MKKDEVAQAIDRLIGALYELEKGRQEGQKEFQSLLKDPERLGALFERALSRTLLPPTMLPVGTTQLEVHQLPAPEIVQEEIDIVTQAVLAKMEQMESHIAEAVSELPSEILQKVAEKVKAGEEFVLRRRRGCVHIDFGTGDDEFYLKL